MKKIFSSFVFIFLFLHPAKSQITSFPPVSSGSSVSISCQGGFGDGTNAIPAGTYLQTTCINKTGAARTISAIQCLTDNAGTSTLNATNGAGTALLTGAVTCNATIPGASGTQSATVTIAANDGIKFTFVADGTSKQVNFTVTF